MAGRQRLRSWELLPRTPQLFPGSPKDGRRDQAIGHGVPTVPSLRDVVPGKQSVDRQPLWGSAKAGKGQAEACPLMGAPSPSSAETINDGQFHTVELVTFDQMVNLSIDGGSPMTMDNFGKHYTLNSEAPLYVGGKAWPGWRLQLALPRPPYPMMLAAIPGGASVVLWPEAGQMGWCPRHWTVGNVSRGWGRVLVDGHAAGALCPPLCRVQVALCPAG